jgi:SAM-dependent methyltransferase
MSCFTNLWQRYKKIRYCLKNPGLTNYVSYSKYPKAYEFNGRKVLNVGSGPFIYDHAVDIDIEPLCKPDIVTDITKPLPFPDNTFDAVFSNHVLEHIPDWFETFKEMARVTKVGGLIEVWVPAEGSSLHFGPRDHVNNINIYSFSGTGDTYSRYMDLPEYRQKKLDENKVVKNVRVVSTQYIIQNVWWYYILPKSMVHWMCTHLRNIATEQQFLFQKQGE